jgi:uncharacterized damage-inducible protein DinB
MSTREFFIKKWEGELPAFGRVLRALPPDQLAYKPHERSACAGDLAWQLAEEQRALKNMVDTGEINWDSRPRPATLDEIVAAWDGATEELRQRLSGLDETKWTVDVKFLMGGQVLGNGPMDDYFWGFLFDMVHHRGQLSTYLRPMGGKVPSIYGPSADDSGS